MGQRITIFCDGATEPVNPGGEGCCAFVAFEGEVSGARGQPRPEPIKCAYALIGRSPEMTNNIAEWRAVLAALRWAENYLVLNPELQIEVRTDSQLVVKQANGVWGCHAEHLVKFRDAVQTILRREKRSIELVWVPREQNDVADALTRLAYEENKRQV